MNAIINNKERRFLPILLGTDANCYGMARSFHEAFGIVSLALGKYPLLETKHSKIVQVQTQPDFENSDVFLNVLKNVAAIYAPLYDHLFLIACGDRYTELVCEHKHDLQTDFIVPYIDNSLKCRLENKEDFYKICEEYKLPYPKTHIITQENKTQIQLPFDFPVAVKASNSIEYVLLEFDGKKKGYKADNLEQLQKIVNDIYQAGYKDHLIVQDFIPGDDDAMYVLNSYSNLDGKVQMMCLGRCVLEDYTPAGIGNYNAIIQHADDGLYDIYENFLNALGFIGFSNFDIKFDSRDNTYKVFEINIRQGRSSFFTTASGANLAQWMVQDVIDQVFLDKAHRHNNPFLWLHVPKKLVRQYASTSVKDTVFSLLRRKKYTNTLHYRYDKNPLRQLLIARFYHKQWHKYKLWWGKRTID